MKDLKSEPYKFTSEEIFSGLKKILQEVAPLKVVGEITPETSLIEDFAFDSIDMMQMLIKIKENFLGDKDLPQEHFFNEIYCSNEEQPVRIENVCRLITEYA
jgi:acyl carrier protein